MRFRSTTWGLLSVALLLGAIFCWRWAEGIEEAKREAARATNNAAAVQIGAPMSLYSMRPAAAPAAASPSGGVAPRLPHVITNTDRPLEALVGEPRALLLANALIDTTQPWEGQVPPHLKAEGDPGAYLVQWQEGNDRFVRAGLAELGAQVISYVPVNAFLVRFPGGDSKPLSSIAGVASVLPYEPYYKLERSLLVVAAERADLEASHLLRLTLFPGAEAETSGRVEAMGGRIVAGEPGPFGPQITVVKGAAPLDWLARLAGVQAIETERERVTVADLARPRVGVWVDQSTNQVGTNLTQYLDLTGTNVWVNINDTQVDDQHPDLENRVFAARPGALGADPDGHGTFVAGILAGDGAQSASITNSQGTATNASLAGIAPGATLFVQALNESPGVSGRVNDTRLIETAARTNFNTLRRTNALISNNSWLYGGSRDYDSAAARFDKAVRDALPTQTGEQPLLFVFAAGNGGFGEDNGRGGEPNSIFSPGTAKNVITVGSTEQPRGLTNFYVLTNITTDPDTNQRQTNYTTNTPFLRLTDSNDEVAGFSSRGNVGIGLEGTFGRFKPDVVVPGSFLLSARSRGFESTNAYDTNMPVGQLLYDLNEGLGTDDYRYESGTSISVPIVSGMLALVQEFFGKRADASLRTNYLSPALMKAFLINSARSLGSIYNLEVRNIVNIQGWGLPYLPRMIPDNLTNGVKEKWTTRFVDQKPEHAVATGQSRTWEITLSTNASQFPLRATLVWTDPPGNPSAAVKLVNDLDLVIRSLDQPEIAFYGNDIAPFSDVTSVVDTNQFADGSLPRTDKINNVENILIGNPDTYGRRFSVTVVGRKVNVDAVHGFFDSTGLTNDVAQDYALVISSDLTQPVGATNQFDIFEQFVEPTTFGVERRAPLKPVANAIPLLEERVGANASLLMGNGVTNQWNFYVFTNAFVESSLVGITNGSNVAFVTFITPNLSQSRVFEADVDLYVSRDPRLTNLAPAVINSTNPNVLVKSVTRGGTETIVLSNALPTDVFYVGVKSEDHQGAEFSLITISTDLPFEEDFGGRKLLRGFPITAVIPDGTPNDPSAAILMAIGISANRVQRVVVDSVVHHENMGDLFGILSHSRIYSVLNNHDSGFNNTTLTNFVYNYSYDDSFYAGLTNQVTDGPGSLVNYAGYRMTGPWIFQQIDDAGVHSGTNLLFNIWIDPIQDGLLPGVEFSGTVSDIPLVYPIDIPSGVTNLIVRISPENGAPLIVSLRKDLIPTPTEYDFRTGNNTAGGNIEFSYGLTNLPPISAGTWFLSIENPNPATPVNFKGIIYFEYGADTDSFLRARIAGAPLSDDATLFSTHQVDLDKVVTDVSIGLAIDHLRVPDLSVRLISPQGTRLSLAENRGAATNGTPSGYGGIQLFTNRQGVVEFREAHFFLTENTNLARVPMKYFAPPFGDFTPDVPVYPLTDGFEAYAAGNYTTNPPLLGAWSIQSGAVAVVNNSALAYTNSQFAILSGARMRRDVALVAGQSYRLRFAYRDASFPAASRSSWGVAYSTGVIQPAQAGGAPAVVVGPGELDRHYSLLSPNFGDILGDGFFRILDADLPVGAFNNRPNSFWISRSQAGPLLPAGGSWVRTHFFLHGKDLANTSLSGAWGSLLNGSRVVLNGAVTNFASASLGALTPFQFNSGFVRGVNYLDFRSETPAGGQAALQVELALTSPDLPANDPGAIVLNPISQGRVTIAGLTNTYVGGADWKLAEMEFIANATTERLEFESDYPGLAIDSVEIEATGLRFALPEESLDQLDGERTLGEWTLEVWDNKTGEPLASLVSWKLDLAFAEPDVRAELLRTGSTYPTATNIAQTALVTPGVIYTNQTHYFMVDTCLDTTSATITLVGLTNIGRLEMFVDHQGIPTGDPEKDDFRAIYNVTRSGADGVAVVTLTTNSPSGAPLRPGKPFFIAVRNLSIGETNTYNLRADLNRGSCLPRPAPRLVTAAKPTLVSSLSSQAVNGTERFTFQVPPSKGALKVSVSSVADLEILLRKNSEPTDQEYDVWVNRTTTGEEVAEVGGATPGPVPPEGTWHLLVRNLSPTPASYVLSIEGVADGDGAGQPLVDGQSLPGATQAPGGASPLYKFTVAGSPDSVLFELTANTGNVDLLLKRGQEPVSSNYDYISARPGTSPEQIVLRATQGGSLDGVYYLSVVSRETFDVSYLVRASTPVGGVLTPSDPLSLSAEVLGSTTLNLSWPSVAGERYRVETSANLVEWSLLGTHTAAGSTFQLSLPAPSGEGAVFYRVSQIP